jgi:hypothetical protein
MTDQTVGMQEQARALVDYATSLRAELNALNGIGLESMVDPAPLKLTISAMRKLLNKIDNEISPKPKWPEYRVECARCGGVVETTDEPGTMCKCLGTRRDWMVNNKELLEDRVRKGNRRTMRLV